MPFSLSPESERLLAERLERGSYASVDDVIRAALSALDEVGDIDVELDEEMLDSIDRSEDQIDRGEVHDVEDVRAFIQAKFFGSKSE